MREIQNAVSGKKTHIVAILMVLYGALSLYFGKMSMDEAMMFVLNGLGLSALRAGVSKVT